MVDDADEPKVDLVLSVKSHTANVDLGAGLQLLPAQLDLPSKPKKETAPVADGDAEPIEALSISGQKRKRGAEDDIDDVSVKKAKAATDGEQEVYVIEDDGAILLDD